MTEAKLDLSNLCMRARGFLSHGRIDDAFGLYRDVLQIDPANAMAYGDRGTAYAMLKKFDLALRDLEQAISFGYADASIYNTVATIHFELKDFEKSLDYFSKAVDLDPDYLLAYYNRSNVLHELGKNKAAIADLEKCVESNSDESFRQLIFRRLNFLRGK